MNTGEMTEELFEAILTPVAEDKHYIELRRGSLYSPDVESRNCYQRAASTRWKKVLISRHGPGIVERVRRHCEAVTARTQQSQS